MGGMHSTSRGVHNLAMTADMPIAQYSMDELLDLLDNALDSDATAADAARIAVPIAQRAGARTIRPSALATVTAACRFLRRPHAHATPLCEVWFAILALVWTAQMIAPSARRRSAGYGQGMPTSALLALYNTEIYYR